MTKMEPNPQDIATAVDGARLYSVMPYIKDEIAGMERALDTRIFSALQEGTLTPDAAFQAWQEKMAYRSLTRRLETRVRVGKSVGDKLNIGEQ